MPIVRTVFDECSICLEKMFAVKFKHCVFGVKVYKLPCGHLFHKECFNKIKNNKCPLCNRITDKLTLRGLEPNSTNIQEAIRSDQKELLKKLNSIIGKTY